MEAMLSSHLSHLWMHPTVHLHVTVVCLSARRVCVKALKAALDMQNLGFCKPESPLFPLRELPRAHVCSTLCNQSVDGSGAVRWQPLLCKSRMLRKWIFDFCLVFLIHTLVLCKCFWFGFKNLRHIHYTYQQHVMLGFDQWTSSSFPMNELLLHIQWIQ